MLNKGGNIKDLVVAGKSNVVEKIVQIEDKEQMAEFEEKLQKQKEDIKLKAQKDKEMIEN